MNKKINKNNTLSLIDHLAIVVNDVSKSVEYYSKNFVCNVKFEDDTWSLLEFQNINLALVTQEEHPNHFAVVDENLSKNNNMKYHRDGIGYIYSQDLDNNFIEIIDRPS
tara:strand:- start:626 stop:952 length:327 start_codon:yes stop_codon:yes gene_type:complete